MSWVKKLATSGFREFIRALGGEVEGLRKDLEELARNRKNTWTERYAVLTAYDWLHEHLVELKMIYMSEILDKYPELRAELGNLIDGMEALNIWMTDTFMDLMNNAELEPVP